MHIYCRGWLQGLGEGFGSGVATVLVKAYLFYMTGVSRGIREAEISKTSKTYEETSGAKFEALARLSVLYQYSGVLFTRDVL